MSENLTIVILAAGLGTRMKSRKAKVLHAAGGLTLVEHVVRSAMAVTSPERVVVVVGHQADEVRSVLAAHRCSICRSDRTERYGSRAGDVPVRSGDVRRQTGCSLRRLPPPISRNAARVARSPQSAPVLRQR